MTCCRSLRLPPRTVASVFTDSYDQDKLVDSITCSQCGFIAHVGAPCAEPPEERVWCMTTIHLGLGEIVAAAQCDDGYRGGFLDLLMSEAFDTLDVTEVQWSVDSVDGTGKLQIEVSGFLLPEDYNG